MTKIAIVPNAAGTGTFTIEAPNSNSNRTLVLPDSAGTVATAESTLAQFNVTGSAPVYACRAWVNFDGTGTVAIRASGNVSSITDNGVGNYTVNFTTAMPDADYAANGTSDYRGSGAPEFVIVRNRTTASCNPQIVDCVTGNLVDVPMVSIAIFR
jgi:hypothetical protein